MKGGDREANRKDKTMGEFAQYNGERIKYAGRAVTA